jgi:hypothetical protein
VRRGISSSDDRADRCDGTEMRMCGRDLRDEMSHATTSQIQFLFFGLLRDVDWVVCTSLNVSYWKFTAEPNRIKGIASNSALAVVAQPH